MMWSSYTAAIALPFLSLFSSFACAQDSSSLTDVLSAHVNLSEFQSLLTKRYPQILSTLESYTTENPITILAPSNHAFDSIQYSNILKGYFASNGTDQIAGLLSYHVVPGNWNSKTLNSTFRFLPTMTSGSNFSAVTLGQRIGAVYQGGEPRELVFTSSAGTRSVVTTMDVPFKGGMLQIIDNFLVPPVPIVDTIEDWNLAYVSQKMTAFLGAVYALPNNSLAQTLNTTKDLTIFIPSNVALEIVSGALESMSNSSLQDLLEYHVLPSDSAPLYSSDFGNGTTLNMLSGATAQLSFIDNAYFLNSARLLTTDILIYNGVIHMVDNVLNPQQTSALPNPTSATQIPVLSTMNPQSFNGSQAPYTTYIPEYVPSATPTSLSAGSASSVLDAATGAKTSAAPSSTVSSQSKKSGASVSREIGWSWPLMVWAMVAVGSCISFLFL